ncbi:uncharacterized protein LOC141695396 [Apium graveolens]|uniref:uncharacterized protein LOC141695396 n=1 Tax=Apium graveolens TaxID=4045 RepID=UPI003D791077
MERSFELVRLGEEQKTVYAAYFLKGEVIYWWDSVKALEEVQPVTWTRFKELFLEKYYPRFMQKHMEMNFLELKQGKKAQRFQQGLEYWIQDRVSMFEIGTYAGVVQKAALIESNGAQSRKERDVKKRKVFHQKERSESGYQQDRNVKRIGFQKGWNAQKKGEVNKRQDNKGNHQQNQGQANDDKQPRIPGVTCYKCGKVGHIAKECRSTRLIKSMMNISSTSTVAPPEMLALPPPPTVTPQESDMSEAMSIVIANQEKIPVSQFCPQCEIDISGHKFSVDLILFMLGEFDIILGMDWLRKNNAQIYCRSKKVYLRAKNESKVIFKGQKQAQLFLTAIQANKLLTKGCEAYLAYVVDSEKEVPSMEEIPVVR